MTQRKFELHDGQKGAAIAIRVTPRAAQNKIIGALSDGTIKIHLTAESAEGQDNSMLIEFLSEILGIPEDRIDVVAGDAGKDKLVSVLDMDVDTLHKRIVENIEY